MNLAASILLPLILLMLFLWVRKDIRDYARFKLAQGPERVGFYRRWVATGFANFTLSSFCTLLVLVRVESIFQMPEEFAGLVATNVDVARAFSSSEALAGFLIGMGIAAVGGGVLGALLWSRLRVDPAKVVGDVGALLPRTGAERFWALLLSVNAGVGEELMFRLLLPLLLILVGLPALPAFALGALLFGLAHWYQGWRGVLLTTLFGVVMTLLYLRSGQLWLVMLLHALVDVNGLIVRPLVGSLLQPRVRPS